MTIEKLLEELRNQREQIDFSIGLIESRINGERSKVKRKALLKEVKKTKGIKAGHSYNGKHWMQDPKNKAKVAKMIARMQKANRLKNAGK